MLVTINYRLSVFGFLATEIWQRKRRLGGNYGLMDMVAALKWVQAQHRAIRRRPEQRNHLRRKRRILRGKHADRRTSARGLFAKAIGESGAAFSDLLSAASRGARTRDQKWTESLGVHNVAELRALPASSILDELESTARIGFGARRRRTILSPRTSRRPMRRQTGARPSARRMESR